MKVGELIGALAEYSLEADVSFWLGDGDDDEVEILSIYSENEDRKDKYVFVEVKVVK